MKEGYSNALTYVLLFWKHDLLYECAIIFRYIYYLTCCPCRELILSWFWDVFILFPTIVFYDMSSQACHDSDICEDLTAGISSNVNKKKKSTVFHTVESTSGFGLFYENSSCPCSQLGHLDVIEKGVILMATM